MADEDKEFDNLLVAFKAKHAKRTARLEVHMNKVKSILESETEGLQATKRVKHAPIVPRLKDAERAQMTLRRRQEDRKQLRDLKILVEDRDHTWEEYCKEWRMEDKINEAEPFTNTDDMFAAMHDLAGIRISVYLPTDVSKVVEFLQGPEFETIEQPSQKGGLARDFQKVRKLVERQRRIHDSPKDKRDELERMEKATSYQESTFPGYKATHMVVRLKKPVDKHWQGDPEINIEVQIGSIVMHAWSDIEHSILYKPSETEKPSPDVVRMLDLINGIVMTGEVALQQLASVADAEATRQAADRTKSGDDWHNVVIWLREYFKSRNVEMPEDSISWWGPRYLFDVLKATNDHNYGRIEALLDGLHPQPPQPERRLPQRLLNSLGVYEFEDPSFKPPHLATTWSARYWATCLVNMVNLAVYMDSSLYTAMTNYSSQHNSLHKTRPTFAEFLDILHPTKPQRRPGREDAMIQFCKYALATTFEDKLSASTASTAVKLAAAGYIARPPLYKEDEKKLDDLSTIFVPIQLRLLTQDSNYTFRITMSLAGDDISIDRYQYFIPSKEDCTWKPVRRESGKTWVITKDRFVNDESLVFLAPEAKAHIHTDHLCKVLGVKTAPDEIRALRKLADAMKIENKSERVRHLHMLTSILDTKDTGKVQQFIKSSDKITGVDGADDIAELAKLAKAFNTMDAAELEEYRRLSRDLDTKDVNELRALKQLSETHGTIDATELKELRKKDKEAEETLAHDERVVDEDPADLRESLDHSEIEDVTDNGGDEDSYYDDFESQSTHRVSEYDPRQQRPWDEDDEITPTAVRSAPSWRQRNQADDTHHSRHSAQRRNRRLRPLYGSDDDDEAQQSYRRYRRPGSRSGASSDEDADDRDRDDYDNNARAGSPAESQSSSKRGRMLKGVGALTMPWSKHRRY